MALFPPLQKRFKFCLIPRHRGCLIPADQLQHMAVVIRNDFFEIHKPLVEVFENGVALF